MRRNLRIRLKLKALALALVVAAGFSGVAMAEQRPGYYPEIEAELALIEGSQQQYEGVVAPDGFQPQLSGGQPLVIRDAPDGSQPQLRRSGDEATSVTDTGRSIVWSDAVVSFSLGLGLAVAGALAIGLTRGRMRMAHS